MILELIIPVPLQSTYTYLVPEALEEEIVIGKRVLVPFGKSKFKTAIVFKILKANEHDLQLRQVMEVLDQKPIVTENQLVLWKWISDYYMCGIGEVMNAALPSSFILKSESKVELIDDSNSENLSLNERIVIESLRNRNEIVIDEFAEILNVKNPKPILNKMIQNGRVYLTERAKDKYLPKFETQIGLTKELNESERELILEKLEKKAPKQFAAFYRILEMVEEDGRKGIAISKKVLLKDPRISDSALKGLKEKGIIDSKKVQIARLKPEHRQNDSPKDLSSIQNDSLDQIQSGFEENKPVLLHGITGSGKTEVYIHLIQEALDKGGNCLYLLPEIALTAQLVSRLQKHFGDVLAVFHSNVSAVEKYEIWKDLLFEEFNKYRIVIGARSALFMPLRNLGLIIVDEEHDKSYKQHDPAPRYNARDASFKLAKINNAKLLFGSATPSAESKWMVQQGKMKEVLLDSRYGDASLPEIKIVDLKQDLKKEHHSKIFSFRLQSAIQEAIDQKDQVILFQNRRGYVPYWECKSCGHIPGCENCDVSLTYHKGKHKLQCHYCSSTYIPPSACSECASTNLKMLGFGTEKIEDELNELFPQAVVQRMDYDTTRGKHSFQRIIDRFEKRGIDILVGTQMVTKGLDFENVSLVGILNADSILNWPDFRSNEHAFQLMTQVSGRAGRSLKKGQVLIQTRKPKLQIFEWVKNADFSTYISHEIEERELFNYPPFSRLIQFSLRHSNPVLVEQASKYFFSLVTERFGSRALGPNSALIARVKRLYIQEILLKIERNASGAFVRETINAIIDRFNEYKKYRSIRIVIDVDPQ